MIYVTGDVHADAYELDDRLRSIIKTGVDEQGRKQVYYGCDAGDTVILLGDVGIRYGNRQASADMLQVMGHDWSQVRFVVMRGNHDARYWRDAKLYNATIRHSADEWESAGDFAFLNRNGNQVLIDTAYPNIEYIRDDGSLYEYDGTRILFIPGAYSVDKDIRQAYGYPYEDEELLTENEMSALTDIVCNNDEPVYVCSHTAPLAWEEQLSQLYMDSISQDDVDKSMESWMDSILDELGEDCLAWYFGHFHADMDIVGKVGHLLFHDIIELGSNLGYISCSREPTGLPVG